MLAPPPVTQLARPLVRLRVLPVLRGRQVAQQRLLLRVLRGLPVPLALQQAVQLQALLDLRWKEALMRSRPRTRRPANSSASAPDATLRPVHRWTPPSLRPRPQGKRELLPLLRRPRSLAMRITRFPPRTC